MAQEDWRDDPRGRDDYGQADYSTDFGYDPARRTAYRRHSPEDPGPVAPSRSWIDRAADFLSPSREPQPDRVESRPRRRRGPSDRVLWAVIVERLEDEARLDLRDVDVIVEDAEVTLNGTVRHKDDRRRIEDVADIRGVRHVQNNLRVRGRSLW
jgi:hypothetical protein